MTLHFKKEDEKDPAELMKVMGLAARGAGRALGRLSSQEKDKALQILAEKIRNSMDLILSANEVDLKNAAEAGLPDPMVDRLRLDPKRIEAMAEGVEVILNLPDPVGEEIERLSPSNGLDIRKVRVPLGVIGIIYESRPNVTIDCAALCLKAGNASVLRGGKEALHTNKALAGLIADTLAEAHLPVNAVQLVPTTDRRALQAMLKQDETIDCIIPRGGEGLIRFVAENSTVPVLKHYKGVCSLTLHSAANYATAESIVLNAKTQRPGVCNAIENLFIDQSLVETSWPRLARALHQAGVSLYLGEKLFHATRELNLDIPLNLASEEDFHTEYLDLRLTVGVVADLEDAIATTNRYSSAHSDGIITEDEDAAQTYLRGVDSATVYWNASTRFTDGFEFGFGAEIGISTDRLHARGPVGLRELTTYKFMIFGKGEIRQ